jgi:hypothetical protein
MSAAHDLYLALVPALAPLCGGDASAAASHLLAVLGPAIAVHAVHAAVMIAASGGLVAGVCGGWWTRRPFPSR